MSGNLKIKDIMHKNTTVIDVEAFKDKDELFRYMANIAFKTGYVSNEKEYIDSLYFRESEGYTYMGNRIAIPHGKTRAVKKALILFCKTINPFLYESSGEKGEVDMIFMLAIPDDNEFNVHLKMLSTLAGLLVHDDVIKALRQSKNYDDVINAFDKYV